MIEPNQVRIIPEIDPLAAKWKVNFTATCPYCGDSDNIDFEIERLWRFDTQASFFCGNCQNCDEEIITI